MIGKMLTTQELCNAIYQAVTQSKKPLSRRDISDALQRKKAPHIIRMIEHLAESGYFYKESGVDKFGRPTWFYFTKKKSKSACADFVEE